MTAAALCNAQEILEGPDDDQNDETNEEVQIQNSNKRRKRPKQMENDEKTKLIDYLRKLKTEFRGRNRSVKIVESLGTLYSGDQRPTQAQTILNFEDACLRFEPGKSPEAIEKSPDLNLYTHIPLEVSDKLDPTLKEAVKDFIQTTFWNNEQGYKQVSFRLASAMSWCRYCVLLLIEGRTRPRNPN